MAGQERSETSESRALQGVAEKTGKESTHMVCFRRSIRESIPQESQDVRDTEGLLETTGLTATRGYISAFH
jgi:hypothetical protein